MNSPQLLAKAFLSLGLSCAVAVVILFNTAGAGLLARLLVYVFLVGLLASGIATAVSFSASTRTLQHMCMAAFGFYTLAAGAVVIWVVVAKPAFG